MKVYQYLAREVSRANRLADGKLPGARVTRLDVETSVDEFCRNWLPSGSGIDSGTRLNWGDSKNGKIVLDLSFHHMNEHGFYTNWTHHKVYVSPCLEFDFSLRIAGQNHNDIKPYLLELYSQILNETVHFDEAGVAYLLQGKT